MHGAYRKPSTLKKLVPNSTLFTDKNKAAGTPSAPSVDPGANSAGYIFNKYGKQVKKEKVDYRKFTAILQGEPLAKLELQ